MGSLSIRGTASSGPFVVVASNFAHGTTIDDIRDSFRPHAGTITSARMITTNPTVIAEAVIPTREGAENVIAMFNNQLVSAIVPMDVDKTDIS